MKIINLPNGKGSFTCENEAAGEFIESIVNGGEVMLTGYYMNDLDSDALKVIQKFINWNYVYESKDDGFLYLKEKIHDIWKMSDYDMTFGDFLDEFYECVDLI